MDVVRTSCFRESSGAKGPGIGAPVKTGEVTVSEGMAMVPGIDKLITSRKAPTRPGGNGTQPRP